MAKSTNSSRRICGKRRTRSTRKPRPKLIVHPTRKRTTNTSRKRKRRNLLSSPREKLRVGIVCNGIGKHSTQQSNSSQFFGSTYEILHLRTCLAPPSHHRLSHSPRLSQER